MQVHRDINNLPSFKNAAITVGTFDGVHTGHLQIINQLKKEAHQNQGESVIITFYPHPRMVINAKKHQPTIHLLNTLSEKIELLGQQQIDHLVIVPFTDAFSTISAEAYIADFIVAKFHPVTIITGYDHRFGNDRRGDYKLLERFQDKFHYSVKEIPEHVLHHISISSTKIREALREGNINTAYECLGYHYFFEGTVIDGNHLGRTLGYPTANLQIEDKNKLIPSDGIYAVKVSIGKEENPKLFISESDHYGMMSIGIRPTIGDNKKMIEVNIFDFEGNIYGRDLRVFVTHYLRPEEKFKDLDALKKQIAVDEINARKLNASEN